MEKNLILKTQSAAPCHTKMPNFGAEKNVQKFFQPPKFSKKKFFLLQTFPLPSGRHLRGPSCQVHHHHLLLLHGLLHDVLQHHLQLVGPKKQRQKWWENLKIFGGFFEKKFWETFPQSKNFSEVSIRPEKGRKLVCLEGIRTVSPCSTFFCQSTSLPTRPSGIPSENSSIFPDFPL